MLTLHGDIDDDELAEAAKPYLKSYATREKETAEIPLKHNGKKKMIQFVYLNKQWVYIGVNVFK